MNKIDPIQDFIINEPVQLINLIGGPFTNNKINLPTAGDNIIIDFIDLDSREYFKAHYEKKGIHSFGVWEYIFVGVTKHEEDNEF